MTHSPLVVITGASSGIGAATATLFASAGYKVGLLARNIAAMEALCLPNSHCIATDVTEPNAVAAAINQIEAKFGPVDCLINNAGFTKMAEFTELDVAAHQHMVSLNISGVLNTISAVLPGMQARKMGTIVNISSVADRNARPTLATYAATKAAIKSLSESLRVANAKFGIRVCNVAPAKVKTPLLKGANRLDGVIEPEELAKVLLWIYQQPQTLCIRDIVVAATSYEP